MLDEKCALGSCRKPLKIAESGKDQETGDRFWMIQFVYRTFFFCCPEHAEEYTE